MWIPDFSPIWVSLASDTRRQVRLERVEQDVEVWTWPDRHECVPMFIAHRAFERNPDRPRDELQTALRGAMDSPAPAAA